MHAARWLILWGLLLQAGCANTPPQSPTELTPALWQGRLAVHIASDPAQAFSANFVLQGSDSEGVLVLTGVFGTRLATLRWSPGFASLQSPQELRQFESVDRMVSHSLGAPLPITALFGWLQGDPHSVAGWEVDLQDRAAGRIRARRLGPGAAADIKIILEPG